MYFNVSFLFLNIFRLHVILITCVVGERRSTQ